MIIVTIYLYKLVLYLNNTKLCLTRCGKIYNLRKLKKAIYKYFMSCQYLILQIVFLQIFIFECKVFLSPLLPLIKIEVHIRSRFIRFGDFFGFFISLKPHFKFFMKPPVLLLQSFSRVELGSRTLVKIEDKEKRIRGQVFKILKSIKTLFRVI